MEITPFANIFSHFLGCLLISFRVSFAVQKVLSLVKSHSFIFVFIAITLGGRSERILLWFISKSIWPMFSAKSFIMSGLIFRSLIHFEFIFVYDARKCSISFFYMWLSSFSSTTYWRDCLFSIVYSCLLCHRLVDFRCVGLILCFLSFSTDLYFCFCASTILFWWL